MMVSQHSGQRRALQPDQVQRLLPQWTEGLGRPEAAVGRWRAVQDGRAGDGGDDD